MGWTTLSVSDAPCSAFSSLHSSDMNGMMSLVLKSFHFELISSVTTFQEVPGDPFFQLDKGPVVRLGYGHSFPARTFEVRRALPIAETETDRASYSPSFCRTRFCLP